MEKTLKAICGMLKERDHARQCGAAYVLARLAPKNAEVVQMLGEALNEAISREGDRAGESFTAAILEALHAIGSKTAVPYVMPLLGTENMGLRMRAVAIIAAAGGAVAPQIKQQLKEASRQEKMVFIDLLARIYKPQTYGVLLDILAESDFGLVKETCEAVQRHVKGASAQERLALHKRVVLFMNAPKAKQHDRVLTSCLLLLGHIGRNEAVPLLLKHSAPQKLSPASTSIHLRRDPNYVRRHALIGLKGLEYTGKKAGALLTRVLPYLDDPDEEMMRHTLGIISRLPASSVPKARWHKLLKNRHSPARSFAVRKLADADNAETNRLLVSLLSHDDNDIREISASALARHKKALPSLLQALTATRSAETAWQLAKILKPHSEAIDKKTLTKFKKLTAKEMLGGKPRQAALGYFLGNFDARASESVLLEVGLEHKRAKRWRSAIESLRGLLHTETFNSDVSYALSMCDLKDSRKQLEPQFRMKDHALRGFESLIRRDRQDLFKRLTKDRSLDAADLYYVGFHFNEGVDDRREFGEELLKLIVTKWPRSQEAKAVRERLKLKRKVKGTKSKRQAPKTKKTKEPAPKKKVKK